MKVWTREDVAKLSPQEVADRLNEAESRVARLRQRGKGVQSWLPLSVGS
jgi:hypothetical protein